MPATEINQKIRVTENAVLYQYSTVQLQVSKLSFASVALFSLSTPKSKSQPMVKFAAVELVEDSC